MKYQTHDLVSFRYVRLYVLPFLMFNLKIPLKVTFTHNRKEARRIVNSRMFKVKPTFIFTMLKATLWDIGVNIIFLAAFQDRQLKFSMMNPCTNDYLVYYLFFIM